MWSVLVFLAGVIFLMKASRDMTKEAQARKRQMKRAARRNAELRKREQMQAQYRRASNMRPTNNLGYGYDSPYGVRKGYGSASVMGYGYSPNRKPIRRNDQGRTVVRRAPQPVLTA